ncbi:MAG TPA: class I SAM-dependent methyltransferase [Bacteroidota bacterium]|nr:class I SAM-dependent methyltransferase [Bacteroidota bacterium]
MARDSNSIEKLFYKIHPRYRHRYEIYNELLCNNLTKDIAWLDIGCGRNEYVADFGHRAGTALGIDKLTNRESADVPFLQADLRNIPLPSNYADLITLRMVVEHLERIPEDLSDIVRLLKPDGRLLLLTTNVLSPVVFLPRLLPFALKTWLIQKYFDVSSEDIFPTYHKLNSPGKMIRVFSDMKLISLEYIEQVPLPNPLLTLLFGLWYSFTNIPGLRYFRSNLLAVFQKQELSTDRVRKDASN